jgi:hypothetical protein
MDEQLVTGDDQQPVFKPTFTTIDDPHTELDTQQAATPLAGMIVDLNADVIAVMEAPSRVAELELFVATYLQNDQGQPAYRCLLGDSGGAQKLGLLSRSSGPVFTLAPAAEIGELINPFLADVDGDAVLDEYHFTRTPLVTRATIAGVEVELIVAHLKSNFINNGEAMWTDPATRSDFVKAALKNRRRIATEAMHLRGYVENRLTAAPDAAIIVLGDLNDGPGRDYFEQLYLAHNVTDILAGSPYEPEQVFDDAPADTPLAQRFTSVFDDFVTNEPNKQLLLDHILLSPTFTTIGAALAKKPGSGTVEHAAWQNHVEGDGARRDQRPTDHRPVTVTLTHT